MKIAVDFDGTCVEHMFPEVGQDVPLAVHVMHKMMEEDYKIFLNTMRSGEHLERAVNWFRERGIFLDGINTDPSQAAWTQSPKCFAHLYIDDAAFGCPLIRPEGFSSDVVDWQKVKEELNLGEINVEKS